MNLTAKPRRGDMGGHANQYFTSSTTGWWSMGTGWWGAANTVSDLDRKRSQVRAASYTCTVGVVEVMNSQISFCFTAVTTFSHSVLQQLSSHLQEDELEAVDHTETASAFVYPPIHAITVCSLIVERKDQCEQGRWKTYGSKDNSPSLNCTA